MPCMICLSKSGGHDINASKRARKTFDDVWKKGRRQGVQGTAKLEDDTDIETYPKSDSDSDLIKRSLLENEFLRDVLNESQVSGIADAMQPRVVKSGEVVVTEGEEGSHLYVSAEGSFAVTISGKGKLTFDDSRVFGELAILYKAKRFATVTCTSHGKIWSIHRDVYQKILVQNSIRDENETLSFLRQVPHVNKLSGDKLRIIANILKREFFEPEKVIVRQGDVGDKFYIIRAGYVQVETDDEGVVAELGNGAFFGELALLREITRQATVTTKVPGADCLTLTRTQFLEHFNEDVFEEIATERKKSQHLEQIVAKEDLMRNFKLEDYKTLAVLGVGGFGKVELIQHKRNKSSVFALKSLKKVDVVQHSQIEHAFNEKDIQTRCDSEFIVRMYHTFKDNKYLYFVMESCMGGDLWALLQKQNGRKISEVSAKFYSGCVLEALTYLHEHRCVYRDLKPENMMLTSKGHLKLTDFGFAKEIGDGKTFTFAGTPEYVAPEIIYNRGHDKAVDYWAFGIFVHELVVGKTPFKTADVTHMKTYQLILSGIDSISFPRHLSSGAIDLIRKLCKTMPGDRLGCQKNGTEDIRRHKWFDDLNWEMLRQNKITPPYVPKLNSKIDVKYFDKYVRDDGVPPDEVSGWDSNF